MGDAFKLQPVSAASLGLPPEAAVQVRTIAKREETPDLDTEKEFEEAADYLERMIDGIDTALERVRAVPAPSEGTTVFGLTYVNAKLGNQIFQYSITDGGDRFQAAGDVIAFSGNGNNRPFEFHYCPHKTESEPSSPPFFDERMGDVVKLAGDGENVFTLIEKLSPTGFSDYAVVRLAESDSAMFGVIGDFESVKIDAPELEGPDRESKMENLLLEDLTVIGDRVYGIYWDLSTRSYLELPLKTERNYISPGPDGYDYSL